VIKFFEQTIEASLLSAFDEMCLWWNVLLMRCFWRRHHFRSTCLQNLFSSDASIFFLVDSIALICSSRTYASKRH